MGEDEDGTTVRQAGIPRLDTLTSLRPSALQKTDSTDYQDHILSFKVLGTEEDYGNSDYTNIGWPGEDVHIQQGLGGFNAHTTDQNPQMARKVTIHHY